MRFLGIDYGTKRIGLAISDESERFAFPYSVVQSGKDAVSSIAEIVRRENVGAVVIGESLDFKGTPNPVMNSIARFSDQLGRAAGVPVLFEKEFFTTAAASRIQGEHEKIDASAAALILKSYLDRRHG